MRSVNTATKNAWADISTPKSYRIYLPSLSQSISNNNIISAKMTESISDSDALFFIGCIASKIEVEINDFSTNLSGLAVEVYVQAGSTTEIKVFSGKVASATFDGSNKNQKIVAYDKMYDIFNKNVASWYNALPDSMTMAEFRASFFNFLGITEESATLVNDSMAVYRAIYGEEILGADIVKAICEINGVFGYMNNDTFAYRSLTTSRRTATTTQTISCESEKYMTNTISKLVIRDDSTDIGKIIGSGSNVYAIEGNILALGHTDSELQPIAQNLYDLLHLVTTYRPIECQLTYNPIYEVGDKLRVPDAYGNTYDSYLLSRTTDFITETDSAKGVSNYESVASTNNDLIRLKGKTNKLVRDVEHTQQTIEDVESGLSSRITQTADSLESQIQNLQSQIDGEVLYYEREGEPTLRNYPANTFCRNIPCNNTVKVSNTLGFVYTEEDYQLHTLDLYYDTASAISYRFAKDENGDFGWKIIADGQTPYILEQISTIKQDVQSISTNVTEISGTVSSQGQTITTMQSDIQQNARNITARVTKQGGETQTFAWHLDVDGFYLESDGDNVMAVDRSGLTVEGIINAKSGNIGGWKIQPYSIDNGLPFTNQKNSKATGMGTYGSNWAFWAGNGKFVVDQDGNVYMQNASIDGYATASTVSALRGEFNTLNAKAITTENFSSQNINANKITSGSINVDLINADQMAVKFINSNMSTYSLNTRSITVDGGIDASGIVTRSLRTNSMIFNGYNLVFKLVQKQGGGFVSALCSE